jgi:hypothetical protein
MRAHSIPALGPGGLLGPSGLLALSAALACLSCSSPNAATCNPCGSTADAAPVQPTQLNNPDGVPYPNPSGGYGRSVRTGNKPGSVIEDFQFQGYPNADESMGLVNIALADYYDPCGKRLKMLHLTVAGVWCVPCNQETDALVAAQAQLKQDGVVVIQALGDGPTEGVAAVPMDLTYWVAKHKSNFTEMLDPGLANLGKFFLASAIPWNCDIDPRTMEIIDSSTGWAGDVTSELQPALTSIPAMPSYPIPAVCGDN